MVERRSGHPRPGACCAPWAVTAVPWQNTIREGRPRSGAGVPMFAPLPTDVSSPVFWSIRNTRTVLLPSLATSRKVPVGSKAKSQGLETPSRTWVTSVGTAVRRRWRRRRCCCPRGWRRRGTPWSGARRCARRCPPGAAGDRLTVAQQAGHGVVLVRHDGAPALGEQVGVETGTVKGHVPGLARPGRRTRGVFGWSCPVTSSNRYWRMRLVPLEGTNTNFPVTPSSRIMWASAPATWGMTGAPTRPSAMMGRAAACPLP